VPKLFSKTWSQADFDRIQKLISLASEGDVSEVEIEADGVRVLVRKHPQPLNQPPLQPPVSVISSPQVVTPPVPAQESTSDTPEASVPSEAPADQGTPVLSPMVGTFYAKPAPDADPFVQVGDAVTKGQIVCIVEAMKVMNEVEADTSGIVLAILAEDGDGVEYDQPLLLIDPSS